MGLTVEFLVSQHQVQTSGTEAQCSPVMGFLRRRTIYMASYENGCKPATDLEIIASK